MTLSTPYRPLRTPHSKSKFLAISNFDQAKTVQATQEAVAATDALGPLKDNTHFNTKAQLVSGAQMGDIILREFATPALHTEEPPNDIKKANP